MSEFDHYARSYEAALDRGIAVSGENATFFAQERIIWLARCLERMQFSPETILDFGCGTGTATPFLFDLLRPRSVLGVDLSAESLEVARGAHRNLAVAYRLTDEYKPDGTIDLAFCNGVFHHVPENDRKTVVNYISDCLRPNGVFALWENNPWSPGARYVMSKIPFDREAVMVWPSEARTLVESAGLGVVHTNYCFIFPRVLKAMRRAEPLLRRLPFGAQYQVLSQKQGIRSPFD